jgi:hypothetical protein
MQRLIDPAVVIVAMVVPTLNLEGFEEALHRNPCSDLTPQRHKYNKHVTGV